VAFWHASGAAQPPALSAGDAASAHSAPTQAQVVARVGAARGCSTSITAREDSTPAVVSGFTTVSRWDLWEPLLLAVTVLGHGMPSPAGSRGRRMGGAGARHERR